LVQQTALAAAALAEPAHKALDPVVVAELDILILIQEALTGQAALLTPSPGAPTQTVQTAI
jgi:hypothetical protein